MAINFLSDLDLSKNKIIGLAVASYSSAPSNPVLGQMYFDTTDSTVYCYNGTSWQEIGGGVDIIDNLNSTRTDAALSANQGKVLNEAKISSTDDTVDDIITLTLSEYNTLKTNNQLQEKTLYNIIDDSTENIVIEDNLTSTSTLNALSANQGRVLKGLVDGKADTTDIPSLTDYVKNTDYATGSKGGVLKTSGNNAFAVSGSGIPYSEEKTFAQYGNAGNLTFISKGTLENIINNSIILKGTTAPTTSTVGYRVGQLYLNTTDNKIYQLVNIDNTDSDNIVYTWQQLIRDIDYATDTKGGVVKTNTYYGLYTAGNGLLYSMVKPYSDYSSFSDNGIISKGTLENVIAGKLYTQTEVLDLLSSYSKYKSYSYDTYANDYYDTQDITDFISFEEFNKFYNNEYKVINFYTNYRSSGKLTINRYNVIESMSRQHLTYDDILVVRLTLSNGNYVDLSADTTTEIVYKGENGPNQPSGGLACFTGNTLVNTKEGLKFIKDIQVGEKVLSYNFDKQKTEYKEVINTYSHYTNLLYKVQTEEDLIVCTYDEPFYSGNAKIQAQFLSKNTKLFTKDGTTNIENIIIDRNIDPRVLVYDLDIKDNHNYFVTSNNILVFTEETTKKELK